MSDKRIHFTTKWLLSLSDHLNHPRNWGKFDLENLNVGWCSSNDITLIFLPITIRNVLNLADSGRRPGEGWLLSQLSKTLENEPVVCHIPPRQLQTPLQSLLYVLRTLKGRVCQVFRFRSSTYFNSLISQVHRWMSHSGFKWTDVMRSAGL